MPKDDATLSAASVGSAMRETRKPVGLTGLEYRKEWNRLNRDRTRAAWRRYMERHPEKKRKIPRDVVSKYRSERRHKDKGRYYAGWENASQRQTRWTAKETELLVTHTGTDRELSALLGRSISAIQHRRRRMKTDE
jgi:hypothetical protein